MNKNNNRKGEGKDYKSNSSKRKRKYNTKSDTRTRCDEGKISRKSDREANGEKFYEAGSSPNMKNPNIKSERNDASWYTYSPDILRVATAVNFNQAIGVPYTDEPMTMNEAGDIKLWPTTPSLLTLAWTPVPGMALPVGSRNNTNSPVNLQMRSLYSLIQATVTQNLPFAAADLGIHLMFMDSVFTFWGHLQRFYYLYRVYKSMNRTLPRVFFNAYRLNPDNLVVDGYDIADFQADMLSLQQEMRRIAVPDGFDVLNRHYWLSKHVFKDDDVVRSQLYMFVPDALWHFNAEGTTGGELELKSIPSFAETGIKGMVSYFRSLLTSYYNDVDIWNLNGYLLRAFSKFWMADDFQLDAIYEPQYVPEVLMQIHNANPVGPCVNSGPFYGTFGIIYQDSMDNIVCEPAALINNLYPVEAGGIVDRRIFFDMPTDTPTEGDIMVASRLISRGYYYLYNGEIPMYRLQAFGTEIVNYIIIDDGVNYQTTPERFDRVVPWGIDIFDEGQAGIICKQKTIYDLSLLSNFKSAPLYPLTVPGENGADRWVNYIGDIRNYVVFDVDVLYKLHDAAAMGEWYIKQ
jgi:hypothetical protein